VQRIFNASERLAAFPESGRIVPEVGRSEVREVLVGKYRLMYQLLPEEVEVLTVIHGSRLLERKDLPQ
jgi:plasmid stabilization system protein ParE